MIFFEQPLWLLLLLPLAAGMALRPFPSRSANVLQGLIFLLLLLALAGMGLKLPEKRGILMVLCDRSLSMPPGAGEKMLRTLREIHRNRPEHARTGVIAFAGKSVMEKYPSAAPFNAFSAPPENRDATALAAAMEQALGTIPRGTPGRILLISDGQWNGPDPGELFTAAALRNIGVDFLPLRRERAADFAVTAVSGPLTAVPGEYYALSCRIRAPFAAKTVCRIRKNEGPWQERLLTLREGENTCFWRDRHDRSGVVAYEVELLAPAEDKVPENNRARHFVRLTLRNRILLATRSPSGNLGKLLRRFGFEAEILPPEQLTPEKLAACQALILENVPCSAVAPEVNRLAAELVRKGRMGVLMTGGRSSFAVGGWFHTPIGDVLPAAMEKQNEIRRNRAAVMISLDRSGSMSVAVDGVTKMAMADLAAVETFKLLAPDDEFGLTAVDSSVHTVVPMAPKKELADAPGSILAIESMGGGIFVDKALHDGIARLMDSKAPVRHLLLFADAADAEQPGDYKELLARSSKAGITVSVVGLGSLKDSDAGLLQDIARRGGGKCYFSDRADELPRIFAEDTFVMVRNSFKEGPTRGRFTGAAGALPGGEALTGTVACNGFNLSFPRKKSTVLLTSDDEEQAPLALTGYAELGRSAALAIEADGEYTGPFASQAEAARLIAFLTRYVAMPQSTGGGDFLVTQKMRDGEFRAEIHLDPDREREPFARTPRLSALILTPDGKVERQSREFLRESPDRLSAVLPVPPGGIITCAVEREDAPPLPLAPAVRSISPEFSGSAPKDITALVRSTGGRIRGDFADIWDDMPRRREETPCGKFLLAAAMALILLQTALRRFGWRFPALRLNLDFRSLRLPVRPRRVRPLKKAPVPPPKKETAPPAETAAGPEENALGSALKRAKRK